HLNPFVMDVTPKGDNKPTYKVLVTFGCHTFTREFKPGDGAHLIYNNGDETRAFCVLRHGLSRSLPDMVRNSAAGKAYFSNQGRNFFVFEKLNQNGQLVSYPAYFNLEAARSLDHDVIMFVVSAYPKSNLPTRDKITMATLVSKVARGEEIK